MFSLSRLEVLLRAGATACLLLLLLAGDLHAYIDPISGSIILQVVGAALLAAALSVKRVWTKVTGGVEWMLNLFRAPDSESPNRR